VQDLLNTRSLMRGFDRLSTPEQARAWLAGSAAAAGAGLSPPDLAEVDREPLRTAREALRAACEAPAGQRGRSDPALPAVALTAPVVVDLDARGTPVARAHPDAPPVLAAVLAALINAADRWPRLKICANPGCRWAFYDTSRNHSGTWCDMNVCGARAKMQRYRRVDPGR
jgi:predicted RNA-binding Zn ribbon-like protein